MGIIDYVWLGLTVLVVAAGLINLFVLGRRVSQKIVKNASKSKPVLWIEGVYPTGKKGYFTVPLEDE